MQSNDLMEARKALDTAIKSLETAHAAWSESVTTLHMAEVKLREAQRHMQQSYYAVTDILNGDG